MDEMEEGCVNWWDRGREGIDFDLNVLPDLRDGVSLSGWLGTSFLLF